MKTQTHDVFCHFSYHPFASSPISKPFWRSSNFELRVLSVFLFKDNMMVFLKGNDGSDGQNGTQVCHLDPKFKRQQ